MGVDEVLVWLGMSVCKKERKRREREREEVELEKASSCSPHGRRKKERSSGRAIVLFTGVDHVSLPSAV